MADDLGLGAAEGRVAENLAQDGEGDGRFCRASVKASSVAM
jgi:hypothetical protein